MVLIINFSNILSIYSQCRFSESALGYIQLLKVLTFLHIRGSFAGHIPYPPAQISRWFYSGKQSMIEGQCPVIVLWHAPCAAREHHSRTPPSTALVKHMVATVINDFHISMYMARAFFHLFFNIICA